MALIQCPECGSRVSEHAVTCPRCGAPMPVKCRECGKLLSSNAVICPSCGCPTSGQSRNSQRPLNNPRQGKSKRPGSMSFGEAISQCFSKYATFSGRARRSEYWYFYLFVFMVNIPINIIPLIISISDDETAAIFSVLLSLISFFVLGIPCLAAFVRRLHDIGKSGANVFWALVPILGVIMLLVWLLQDSDAGENEYGPSPKYQ